MEAIGYDPDRNYPKQAHNAFMFCGLQAFKLYNHIPRRLVATANDSMEIAIVTGCFSHLGLLSLFGKTIDDYIWKAALTLLLGINTWTIT